MKAQKEGSTMIERPTITTPNKSAEFLRAKREELGLSVREAAERVGVSAQTLRRYERQGLSGSVRCSHFKRLAKAYGTSTDHLCSLMMQTACLGIMRPAARLGVDKTIGTPPSMQGPTIAGGKGWQGTLPPTIRAGVRIGASVGAEGRATR